MKKYTGVLLMTMAVSLNLFAQDKKEKSTIPPAEAKIAFQKKFPGALKVKWEKEKMDYEVNFVEKGTEMSAVYDSKGIYKESEVSIPVNQLPVAVQAYIKDHFSGSKIKEAAKITDEAGVVSYEAEINKQDLLFDSSGKFLKVAKN